MHLQLQRKGRQLTQGINIFCKTLGLENTNQYIQSVSIRDHKPGTLYLVQPLQSSVCSLEFSISYSNLIIRILSKNSLCGFSWKRRQTNSGLPWSLWPSHTNPWLFINLCNQPPSFLTFHLQKFQELIRHITPNRFQPFTVSSNHLYNVPPQLESMFARSWIQPTT